MKRGSESLVPRSKSVKFHLNMEKHVKLVSSRCNVANIFKTGVRIGTTLYYFFFKQFKKYFDIFLKMGHLIVVNVFCLGGYLLRPILDFPVGSSTRRERIGDNHTTK